MKIVSKPTAKSVRSKLLRTVFGGFTDVFSPASLFANGEPGVWFDPSDISTLFQDSAGTIPVTAVGQPVGRMLDKSGRGNHATQSTAASRPTYQIVNGKACLQFDGVDDFMVTPTITPGTDKVQVFAGVRKLSDAASGIVAELSANTGSNAGALAIYAPLTAASNFAFGSRGDSAGASNAISGTTFGAPTSRVVTGLGDISGDRATIRINGTQAAQSTADQGAGNYLAYPIYFGRRGGTTLPFNGYVFRKVIRFGSNLADATIASVESWINQNTGAY